MMEGGGGGGGGGAAVIRRGERFILNVFRNRSCAPLFINSTVTAIILHFRECYFFDSHDRDSRGLSVADGSSGSQFY